jgi:putative colanic acid biosynthesis glycosyltransferase
MLKASSATRSGTPTVSLVSITLNNLLGLQATWASVLQQDLHSWEWRVVDGGSIDGSVEFLRGISDDRVRWSSGPDRGIFDAMNVGLADSRGLFVCFLNAGDRLQDGTTLRRISAVATQSPAADLIYGDAMELASDGRIFRKKAISHHFVLYGMFTHHQAMIYRRATIGDLRYSTEYTIAGDYDFTCRFISKTREIVRLREPLCVFERGGLSSRRQEVGLAENDLIRRKVQSWSPIVCDLLLAVQSSVAFVRNRFPRIYSRLRF